MKEFVKFFLKEYPNIRLTKDDAIFALHIWIAALEHYNKLFLDGMHPADVIFAMQKELEEE